MELIKSFIYQSEHIFLRQVGREYLMKLFCFLSANEIMFDWQKNDEN